MKKTKYFIFRFVLLSLILAVFGCKSVSVLPTKEPVKRVELKSLTKEIEKATTKIKTFRARVKVQYKDSKREQQINLNLRMESNKILWISASILVPIAKLLITPNRVGFYEKFQKTFYEGNMSFINEQLGTSFTFEDIQNVFLGNPVTNMNEGEFDRIDHPQYYVLIPKTENKQLRPTYFFDPSNFRLKEQRFIVSGTSQSLSIKYPKYQKMEGKTLPKEIVISIFDGFNLVQVSLDFIRTDFPKNLSVPFTIPDGFKKLSL